MSDSARSGPSHRSVEMGTALVIAAFAVLVIIGSLRVGITWGAEGPRSGFFPFYLGIAILLASGFNLVEAWMLKPAPLFAEWGQLRQVLAVVIPTAVYVCVIPYSGIYLASMILIALFMIWLGKYRIPITAAIAIGVPVAIYMMFEKWFLVPLPKGPIEDWLGL